MKLVSPDTSYDAGKSNLSEQEHLLANSAFAIIQAFRKEVSEHDEDPGFDFDDAMSALIKSHGFGKTLVNHFMENPNIAKSVEIITHGVVRNLGVLEPEYAESEYESEPNEDEF